MFKYSMIIDGDSYIAVFADHMEAADFLDANDRDGATVVITSVDHMTPDEVLADTSLSESYRVELAASVLVPNHRDFPKVDGLRTALRELGYTW